MIISFKTCCSSERISELAVFVLDESLESSEMCPDCCSFCIFNHKMVTVCSFLYFS